MKYSNETSEQKSQRVKLIQKELGLNQSGEWDKQTNDKYTELMNKRGVDAVSLSEHIKRKDLKSRIPQSQFKLDKTSITPTPEIKEDEDSLADSLDFFVDLGKNWLDRTIKKYGDDEAENIPVTTKPVNITTNKTLQEKPIKALSDTIKDNSKFYRVPMSLDLDQMSGFKNRNRGDKKELNTTSGALISTFYPFVEKNKFTPQIAKTNNEAAVIGINNEGKIKVGNYNEFDDTYKLTETFSPEIITDIDLSGNQYDSNLKRPVVKGVRPNGSLANLPIGLGKDKSPNKLSDLSGGKILISTPDKKELQFIYGTPQQLKDELNQFKTKYKTNEVLLYHLDNGTYNQTLQPYNKKLTSDDLKSWDNKNTGGGHFLYYQKGGILKYKKGSIYIKPENRGKFTETKKRTGKSTEELTHSKNPVTRKRAVFALNAKKWKHQTGGTFKPYQDMNKEKAYQLWKKTAPYNLYSTDDTNGYNLRGYWEDLGSPKSWKEGMVKNNLKREDDGFFHGSSVSSSTGEFLKPKNHPSVQLELDWYNSPDAKEFRSQNKIDSSGVVYKYVPIKKEQGGLLAFKKGGYLKDKNTYVTKDGKETKRGLWANVYLKNKNKP